jgi:ribose 5-phosphate isomerase B
VNIIIGCDQNALQLKNAIKEHIEAQGHTVDDVGVFSAEPVMYPDIALKVAEDIADGKHERGILICGTGIGMAMVANKVPGVRAAQAHDVYSAERARKSNDAQILTFGAQVIGVELAKKIVDAWLASEFAGGRSAPKVAKIKAIDERFRRRD